MNQDNSFDFPLPSGLSLRHFGGEADFAALAGILQASENADGIERQVTPQDLAAAYQRLENCDPFQDLVLAEAGGAAVGYCRGWWRDEGPNGRLYGISGFLRPEFRRGGIGRAMLAWMERRLRAAAAGHPPGLEKFFQAEAGPGQTGKTRLLEEAGYQPVRCFYEMLRPNLEELPNWPLPPGLELRPVLPEHYPAVWKSIAEASQDEWGYLPPTEERYREWLAEPHFQPWLWQIAWDAAGGVVAGHVLTFIDPQENTQMGRRRGYTEGVGVGPAWRRRGLARALVAASLAAQKKAGMAESALVVDTDGAGGAIRLYESCGFQVTSRSAIYRKSLDPGPPAGPP